MRTSRLRDWLFAAKRELARDPSLEQRLLELDRLISDSRATVAVGVVDDERTLMIIEAYGEVTREMLTAAVWMNGPAVVPYVKRAQLHHVKLMQALATMPAQVKAAPPQKGKA